MKQHYSMNRKKKQDVCFKEPKLQLDEKQQGLKPNSKMKLAVKKIMIDRKITPAMSVDAGASLSASSLNTVSSRESKNPESKMKKKRRTKTYNAACRLNFTNGKLDGNSEAFRKSFGADITLNQPPKKVVPPAITALTNFASRKKPMLRFSDKHIFAIPQKALCENTTISPISVIKMNPQSTKSQPKRSQSIKMKPGNLLANQAQDEMDVLS